jgi:hypothetical protein
MMTEMDPQFIREREAWYKAGAGAVAAQSGVGVLVISAVMGLVTAIWKLDASEAVVTTGLMCLGWIAASNGIVVLGARKKARRGGVEVDRY